MSMTVKKWTLLTIKECLRIEESGPFLDDVNIIHVSTINDPCFIMVNLDLCLCPLQLDLEEVWSGIDPGLLAAVQSVYTMIHDSGELGIGHFRLKVTHSGSVHSRLID